MSSALEKFLKGVYYDFRISIKGFKKIYERKT